MSQREIIKQFIELIRIQMNTDEFITLRQTDIESYKKKLACFVPEFSEQYKSIFDAIINSDENINIDKLIDNQINKAYNFQQRESIQHDIDLLRSKIDTVEFDNLKKNDQKRYKEKLAELVPNLKNKYEPLFNMIIEKKDISILYKMFNAIDDIDTGKKTLNCVRNELAMDLHNQYVAHNINK